MRLFEEAIKMVVNKIAECKNYKIMSEYDKQKLSVVMQGK